MQAQTIDRDRRVIPVWHELRLESTRELSPLRPQVPTIASDDLVFDLHLRNWSTEPNLINAAEVIDAAALTGNRYRAWGAAKQIIEAGETVAPALLYQAKQIYDGEADQPVAQFVINSGEAVFRSRVAARIREVRRHLHFYPRDEFLWIELARLQCLTGNARVGKRAVETALGLNGTNRAVLRAAARYFIHVGDKCRAYSIIARSPLVQADPWLAAAEISIASMIERKPKTMKSARRLAKDENFSAFHLAELSSAIGTEHLKVGSEKLARRAFASSLRDPNANALAQGVWAEQWLSDLVKRPRLAFGGEAAVRSALAASEYKRALDACWGWFEAEPYSVYPAANGSFIATALAHDYEAALGFVQRGLVASPNNVILLNNATVSLCMLGRVTAAREHFSKLKRPPPGRSLVIYLATAGLVEFRDNRPEAGNRLYMEAMQLCLKTDLKLLAFRVFTHWVVEEARSGGLGGADAELLTKAGDRFVDKNPTLAQQYVDQWCWARDSVAKLATGLDQRNTNLISLMETALD